MEKLLEIRNYINEELDLLNQNPLTISNDLLINSYKKILNKIETIELKEKEKTLANRINQDQKEADDTYWNGSRLVHGR